VTCTINGPFVPGTTTTGPAIGVKLNENAQVGSVIDNGTTTVRTPTSPTVTTAAILDVVVASIKGFSPIEPARRLDTRDGAGGLGIVGKIQPGQVITIPIHGFANIPATATGVSMNVTAVGGSNAGWITVYPCDGNANGTSTVNFEKQSGSVDLAAPNAATMGLSAARTVCATASIAVDLVIDVNGFHSPTSIYKYRPVDAVRAAHTRDSQGGARLAAGSTLRVTLPSVPANSHGVMLDVIGVNPTANGYLTVWSCDGARPVASNLNPIVGRARPNQVISPIGSAGTVCVYAFTEVDVVIDITGWFASGAGNAFVGEGPKRVFDTNAGQGHTGALAASEVISVDMSSYAPANSAVQINLTSSNTPSDGFLTAYACEAGGRSHRSQTR
jgi:hypothetical protein